jgi:hypothetical protein
VHVNVNVRHESPCSVAALHQKARFSAMAALPQR